MCSYSGAQTKKKKKKKGSLQVKENLQHINLGA
jgi:hypothetical protein